MDFFTAIRTVLGKYAVFTGRARRSEYWWFFLFAVIIGVIVDVIDLAAKSPIIGLLVELALLLPSLAVGIRRLHDISRSGWWILIGLIPLVGTIILIVWSAQDSSPGTNEYGESPKAIAGGGYNPPPGPGQYGQQY